MRTKHLEILVEERSMEVFLRELIPRMIGGKVTFNIYPSQGKADLLRNLPARLNGYSRWLPEGWRVIVVVDRDDQDCFRLKQEMDEAAVTSGLRTRKVGRSTNWQIANRIAIEELESWYFGDWDAVRQTYPKVPRTIAEKAAYRDPDSIEGGTWETFERVLQRAGYFRTGLAKTDVARALGKCLDPQRNRSASFGIFRDVLLEAVQ